MNYYFLIAGFPELQMDSTRNVPTMEALLEELYGALTEKDALQLDLLRMQYDNRNLLAYLVDKEAPLDPLGILSRNDWDELITLMDEVDMPKDKRLQPYILNYYRTITDEKLAAGISSKEDFLATLYYEFGTQSSNEFVANWFEFNLNINNLLTAISSRKHGFDIKQAIVGNNEIAQTIRKSNTHDFNLSGLFEQVEAIMTIAENKNLLKREKAIDSLKWEWLEEHTFFNYFTIERVLAFYLRCELLHRWDDLTPENGQEIFRQLLDDLKKVVKL
ncbi:MAG TPA: DUF2764 family protein [Paludibacteraceae bacterium]|nr:DUF2764 family protein [Paludibacteraceae bacterium]